MSKRKEIKTVNSLLDGVEKLFLQVMIGLTAPVLGLLTGWWGSIPFASESTIKYFALGGLLAGVFIDILFLRRWVRKAYDLPLTWFALIYLFYSVCVFGFFMGIPVFNLFLGIIAGYYVGLCLRHRNAEKSIVNSHAHWTALFTATVLAVICSASLCIAYFDASLSANIQGMFNLAKSISRPAIMTYSIAAGFILIILEYILTRATVRFARFM